ncbi:unnamed protein product [Auanema sp. JU1783]|nr:unnamed protein product [Auanema sp. JU1783]
MRSLTLFKTTSKILLPSTRKISAMIVPEPPSCLLTEMQVPPRLLFGPGPSNMPNSVAQTQGLSLLGHLHPEFVKVMSDVRVGLQYVFQTKNAYTFAVSGTGHAGMECALLNLLERGEKLLVVQNGIWGERATSLGKRLGLDVQVVSCPPGEAVSVPQICEAIEKNKPKVVFVCHGESSTGVCHPLAGIKDACEKTGTLFLVDTVASLGGAPFSMDELGVDCVYSATQKVLNAPPGLAPISFSDKAIQMVKNRKEPVSSFYFDCLELGNYWGCDGEMKRYHHTAPISSVYALREALAIVAKQGINSLVKRHQTNSQFLYQKLQEKGLECFVEKENIRLPCLTTVKVPESVDWKLVISNLMAEGIEISGGLGPTFGKIFRIGTFGQNSEQQKIENVVNQMAIAIEKSKL